MKHPIFLFLLLISSLATAQDKDAVFVKTVEKTKVHLLIESDYLNSSYLATNPMFMNEVVKYPSQNSFSFNAGVELTMPYNSAMTPLFSLGFSNHDYSTVIDEDYRVYKVAEKASCISLEAGLKYRFLSTKKLHPIVQGSLNFGKYLNSSSYYRMLERFDIPYDGEDIYSDRSPGLNIGFSLLTGLEFPLYRNIQGCAKIGYRYLKVSESNNELGTIKSLLGKVGILFLFN